jgi:carboxyl-terminal processing protease
MEKQPIQNDKTTIRIPIVMGVTLAMGILIGATFFGGRRSGSSDVAKNMSKFREILNYIDKSYVDSVNTDTLVDYSIEKMIEKLDPHTYYFPAKEADLARSQLQSGFDGIGVEYNVFNDTLYVISPLAGGPSEAVGIQSGDAIIKANGVLMIGEKLDNSLIYKQLRGERGTKVDLEIKRRGQKKLLNFTVKRDKIPTYSIDAAYVMSDKKTGYIKINRFSESTYDEFVEHLGNLKKQGIQQLMIDLRGNPGGYMNRATDIIDELLAGKDLILFTDGKDDRNDQKTFAGKDGMFEKGSVVVLVDEGSASASEIVSGALQDHDRAVVVGRRTFGKGLVQQPFQLSDGSELRLTISRYYIPSGRSIQKPYIKGEGEDYEHELYNRKGEFFVADSIKNNSKLKFKTRGGRTVYGGGGITPDVFVPRDTTYISGYLIELFNKNILREYALNYSNQNRKNLEKMPFEQYYKGFTVSEAMLGEVQKLANSANIKFNSTDFSRSKSFIQNQIKALIARQIWQRKAKSGLNNEFFQVIDSEDVMIKTAMSQFVKAGVLVKK